MKENIAPNQIEVEHDLTLDNVMQNTEFFIADGEILKKSQELVAKGYSYFMPKEIRDERVAYDDLCIDESQPEMSTLVALYTNPKNPKETSVLGTIRLVFGDNNRVPPLEAMDLIDVIDIKTGESRWPHQDMERKIDISEICELGRLVFSKEVRKDLEVQFYVARALMQEITNHAKEKNAKLMIGILPNHVYEFASRNAVNLTKLNSDRKIIFKNSPKAKEIREKYPIYWDNLNPSLYVVDFD